MSNETTTKTTTKSRAKKQTPAVVEAPIVEAPIVEDTANTAITKNEPTVEKAKPFIPKEVDLNQLIPVLNGYQGLLVYKSARTNEKFVWPEFGSEQMVELRELRNAKNTWKKYFINNWFMFDEDYAWVIDYLGMGQYYKYALRIDEFDSLFDMSPEQIEEAVSNLSAGQKRSVSYRAKQLIADGEIDSFKAIAALERSLGVELVEKPEK